jgi:FkbM family methyltransferase
METIENRGNISLDDQILVYLCYLKGLNKFTSIGTLLKYRRLYKNYVSVSMGILRKKYPIEAILRNGDKLLLRNELEAQIHGGRHAGFEYDTDNDIVTLSMSSNQDRTTRIKLHGGISNGDIRSVYLDNVYERLPVKGKTVLDIGANIADSSIYFALSGANKVIGLEPFPMNYQLAQKNIKLNGLSDMITVYLAGCASDNREMMIDPEFKSGCMSILRDFKGGVRIPMLTLENVLNNNIFLNDDASVLKMDCEGCEYETVLSAKKHILRKFSHMLIEYHYGYKNLKEKIEKTGFKVTVSRPRMYATDRVKLTEGDIFAERC